MAKQKVRRAERSARRPADAAKKTIKSPSRNGQLSAAPEGQPPSSDGQVASGPEGQPTSRDDQVAPEAERPQSDGQVSRWWDSIKKSWTWLKTGVLTAGSLATAIAAIIALRPSPPPPDAADVGRFTSVSVDQPVSLNEFRERSIRFISYVPDQQQPGPTIDDLQVPPVPPGETVPPEQPEEQLPTPGEEDGTQPNETPQDGTTGPEGDPDTEGPTATATPFDASSLSPSVGIDMSGEEEMGPRVAKQIPQVFGTVKERWPDWDTSCVENDPPTCKATVTYWLASASVGSVVPPEKAADRVVELLDQMRMVSTGSEGLMEPLGVPVTVNAEVSGLRDTSVLLTWQMWQHGGDTRLFGAWLGEHVGYSFTPKADQNTASATLFVPLPEAPGPYVIRLFLAVDGNRLATVDSDPVHF